MLKINLLTGTAWTRSIIMQGDLKSDLQERLDAFHAAYGREYFPVATYAYEELDDQEIEYYVGINGCQYYIEGISSVEEIDRKTAINLLFSFQPSRLHNNIGVYSSITESAVFYIDAEMIDGFNIDDYFNEFELLDDEIIDLIDDMIDEFIA